MSKVITLEDTKGEFYFPSKIFHIVKDFFPLHCSHEKLIAEWDIFYVSDIFFVRYIIDFVNWCQLQLRSITKIEAKCYKRRSQEKWKREREEQRTNAVGLLVFISSARKIRRRRHLHHSAIFWILSVIRRLAMYSTNLYFHPEIIAHKYCRAGEYDMSCLFYLPRLCRLLPLRFFFRNLYWDA